MIEFRPVWFDFGKKHPRIGFNAIGARVDLELIAI